MENEKLMMLRGRCVSFVTALPLVRNSLIFTLKRTPVLTAVVSV